MTIDAQYSSQFSLHDCSTGDLSCNGMSLYVPPNNGRPRAVISGGKTLTSSHGEILQLYAIFSWHDLEIQALAASNDDATSTFSPDHANGIMHCLPDYTAACNLAADSWTCSQSDDICDNPPTQQPTAAPTSSPTPSPSIKPSDNPTIDPSTAPTLSPTTALLMDGNLVQNANQTESEKQAEVLWVLTSILLSILCLIMIILTYYVLHARYRHKEELDNPISIKYTRTSTVEVDHEHDGVSLQQSKQRKSSAALSGFVQALQQGSHVQHGSQSAMAQNITVQRQMSQNHSCSNSMNMHARNDTMLYKGDHDEKEEEEEDEQQRLVKQAQIDEVDDEVTSLDDDDDGDENAAQKQEKNDAFHISTDCGMHINDKEEGAYVNETRPYQQGKRSSIQVRANPLASMHQKHAYSTGGVYPRGSLSNLHHHKLNSYSHSHWNLPTARSPYMAQSKSMQFEQKVNLQRVNSNSSANNSPFSYFAKPESFGITQPAAEDTHIMAYSPFVQHSYSVPPSNLIYTQLQQASGSLLDIYNEKQPNQQAMDLITSPKQHTTENQQAARDIDVGVEKDAVCIGPDTSDALKLITTNGDDEEEEEEEEEAVQTAGAVVKNHGDGVERKDRDVDEITVSAMSQRSASSQVAKAEQVAMKQDDEKKQEAKPFPKGHPGFIIVDAKAGVLSKVSTSRSKSSMIQQVSYKSKASHQTLLSPLSTLTASTSIPQQTSYTQDTQDDEEHEQGESPLIIVNTRLTERDEEDEEEDEEDMDGTNDYQMSEVPLDAIKYGASLVSTQCDDTEMNGSCFHEQAVAMTQTEDKHSIGRTPSGHSSEQQMAETDYQHHAPHHRSQPTVMLLAQSMQELEEQQEEAEEEEEEESEEDEEDEEESGSRSGSATVFISQSTSSASASSSASNSSSGSVYDSDEEKIEWRNGGQAAESVQSNLTSFARQSKHSEASRSGDIAEYYENHPYSQPQQHANRSYGGMHMVANKRQSARHDSSRYHGNERYMNVAVNVKMDGDESAKMMKSSRALRALFDAGNMNMKALHVHKKRSVIPVKSPIDAHMDDDEYDDDEEESQSLRGHQTHGTQHSTLEIQGLINM
eukprot:CAMPEP_0197080566 /NCGR_PEP_ID=MMETSP1384-20130603/214194_1 /TAXON_ID=29189 /ORGANISM="Ammonia sp." /LENGTH=1090 /DNA_ID=CAMNT_0042519453 /DNA_START=423 /DNA_END=3695 /DNA_ORIENTATION=-